MASDPLLRDVGAGHEGTSRRVPPKINLPGGRSQNFTNTKTLGPVRGEEDTRFWITDFDYFGGKVGMLHHREEYKISDLWNVREPVLEKMDNAWEKFCGQRTPVAGNTKVRWIHFPENNSAWAKKMLSNLRVRSEAIAPTRRAPEIPFGTDDFFRKRTNSFGKSHYHARFMRPFCQKRISKRNPSQSEVVFMIPYLQWELDQSYRTMRKLVKNTQDNPNPTTQQAYEEPLFSRNLREHRTQVRRSLDQSFYWTLKDTRKRDEDQVIDRYAKEHLGQADVPRAILMVDQLWLWKLDEGTAKGTIVTLFPRIWEPGTKTQTAMGRQGTQTQQQDTAESPVTPNDPLDVFDQVFHFLNTEKEKANNYRTISEIVCLLIDRCAGNIVDEKLIDDVDRQYIEFYNRYIDLLMAKQKDCLEKLDCNLRQEIQDPKRPITASTDRATSHNAQTSVTPQDQAETLSLSSPDSISSSEQADENEGDSSSFGIAREFEILKSIRDIIEEVGMMIHILERQREAIESLGSQYRQSNTEGSKSSISLPGVTVKNFEWYDGSVKAMSRSRHDTHSEPGWSPPGSPKMSAQDQPRNKAIGRAANDVQIQTASNIEEQATGKGKEQAASNVEEQRTSKGKGQATSKTQDQTEEEFKDQTGRELSKKQIPDEVRKLRTKALKREEILSKLREKARDAEKSILHLLELKQQQANVLETRSSRRIAQASERQSEAIMLFTVVTIFFLPLSTIASIYGMNADEFGQDGPPLSHIWKILFPVSGGLAVGILYIAFHRRVRRVFSLILALVWLSLTDWIPFTWLLSYWEQKLDRKVEVRYKIRKQQQKSKVEDKEAKKEEERKRKTEQREVDKTRKEEERQRRREQREIKRSKGENKAQRGQQSGGEEGSKSTKEHTGAQGGTSANQRCKGQEGETAEEVRAREKREGKRRARASQDDEDGGEMHDRPSSSNQSSPKLNPSGKVGTNPSSGSSGTKVAGGSGEEPRAAPEASQIDQPSHSQPADPVPKDKKPPVQSTASAPIGPPAGELAKKRSKRQVIRDMFPVVFGPKSKRSIDLEDQRQKGQTGSATASGAAKWADGDAKGSGDAKVDGEGKFNRRKGEGKEKVRPAADINHSDGLPAPATTKSPTKGPAEHPDAQDDAKHAELSQQSAVEAEGSNSRPSTQDQTQQDSNARPASSHELQSLNSDGTRQGAPEASPSRSRASSMWRSVSAERGSQSGDGDVNAVD